MLLGRSGEAHGAQYDLGAVTSSEGMAGVEHDSWLRALTETTINNDWLGMGPIRNTATIAMGAQQVVDVLIVASAFNGITRLADATGIPLDRTTEEQTRAMRAETGIDAYDYARKSFRYGEPATPDQ